MNFREVLFSGLKRHQLLFELHMTSHIVYLLLHIYHCLVCLIQNKKEKNQLLMFIRKSNSFLFPLYPDETQISAKPNETKIKKKKQLDKYIPLLDGWNVSVCLRQRILKCT